MTPTASARFQAALADRYVVDDVLGHGGMGTVYLARDVKHGRPVAIKVVDPDSVSGFESQSFLKEIRRTARLQHPHLLPLLDSGEAAGCLYYVMPYVRDGSLRDLLDGKTRLSLRQTLSIARGIAQGLQYAHDNRVIHCDIKPENVLMSAGHPVLADFGVSRHHRIEPHEWRTEIDTSVGTPAYVSPEQASGDYEVGPQSDLYSLACVIYEMLAGETPFTGENDRAVVAKRFTSLPPDIRRVASHVPARVAALLRRTMAMDPRRRPASAARFVRMLERAMRERPLIREAFHLLRIRGVRIIRRLARALFGRRAGTARELLDRSKATIDRSTIGHNTHPELGGLGG